MEDYSSLTAELKRITGLSYLKDADEEKRKLGWQLILQAFRENDCEATYIVATQVLEDGRRKNSKQSIEQALMLMELAANNGSIQARGYLNQFCRERYEAQHRYEQQNSGPLVNFDGKPFTINRKGVFTPVDAVLTYENETNILTLSTNVRFVYCEEVPDPDGFEQAVFRGIQDWEGEYTVFGGQKLTVRVKITSEDRTFDNLVVIPMTSNMGASVQEMYNKLGTQKGKERVDNVVSHKRSFASAGLKWSANSRKIICIQSQDNCFADLEEIRHVTKHEFGHVLGLGDLYASDVDDLKGVQQGQFTELDSYAISGKLYNLVMCDHCGPVSNNDIEMVVLAFWENKIQNYQTNKKSKKISTALGKGN